MKIKICLASILIIATVIGSGCLSQDVVYVSLYVDAGGMTSPTKQVGSDSTINVYGTVFANQIDTKDPKWQKYKEGVYVSTTDLKFSEYNCEINIRITDYDIDKTDNQIKANGHAQTTKSSGCDFGGNPSISLLVYDKDGGLLTPLGMNTPNKPYELSVEKSSISTQSFTLQINYK